jgi:hypothetical protein
MSGRLAAAVASVGSALGCAAVPATHAATPARATAGEGSSAYTSIGRTYYFDLSNPDLAAWQSFVVVAPPGTSFVGGATAGENTARCVVGQPDGQAEEIECGPLSPNAVPRLAHIMFVATVSAPAVCGAPFELEVGTTAGPPFTRVGDVTEAGSCAPAEPTAIGRPTLYGKPVVGSIVRATPPTWSATPTHVDYHWERCTTAACTPIAGAAGLTVKLTRRDAGRALRLVATAIIDGVTVKSDSKKLAIRAS